MERAGFAVGWMLNRVNASEAQRQPVKAIIKDAIQDLLELRKQHCASHGAVLHALAQPTLGRAGIEDDPKRPCRILTLRGGGCVFECNP